MKKSFFLLMIVVLTCSLISCRKQSEKIDIKELDINLSLYYLLPSHIKENGHKQLATANVNDLTYVSPVYQKLINSYQYIEELLIVFNQIFAESLSNHDIEPGEVYGHNHYSYYGNKKDGTIHLTIEDNLTDRDLEVFISKDENNHHIIQGRHHVQHDLFTFNYQNELLTMQFERNHQDINAYALITKENNQVKTHIVYDNGNKSYALYSIATNEACGILYFDQKERNAYMNKRFEVIDQQGDTLYYAFNLNRGSNQGAGWLLHALNNSRIEKVEDGKYLVDTTLFNNEPGEVNLHEIKISNDKIIYLLGYLKYHEQLLPVVTPRKPFETTYYSLVTNLARDISAYYNEINA